MMPRVGRFAGKRTWVGLTIVSLLVLGLCHSPVFATRYVSTTGSDIANDCASSASPCATVQVAVDAATVGEEVRVAAGTYSGSANVIVTRFMEDFHYRQVVFIDKALVLRGGYTEADWDTADPVANVTTIDALADGRPVTIVDTFNEVVVVEGFVLTGGNYTGLGNPTGEINHVCRGQVDEDCGGGLYIYDSAFQLLQSVISGNIASTVGGDGGGIYLWEAREGTISSTQVSNNSTVDQGGGLYATRQDFPLTIRDSTFGDNTASQGGGISLGSNIEALIRLEDCDLTGNTASGDSQDGGGGMFVRLATAGASLEMERVVIEDNEAWGQGKGMRIDAAGAVAPPASLVNVLFIGNGPVAGAPIATEDAVLAIGPGFTSLNVTLAHVTAAGNLVDSFLFVTAPFSAGTTIQVAASNVLLSGFENGYVGEETGSGDAVVEHTNTLFHQVTHHHLTVAGAPTFTEVNPVIGDPLLVNGYLLQEGSAAIDTGVDVGVTDDLDRDPRPAGAGFDIGADEYITPLFSDGFESGDTSAWSVTVP